MDTENLELASLKKEETLFRGFLVNALIEKYESTLELLSKFAWPLSVVFLSIVFYSNVSSLIDNLASNLSRTSKINIAGVEIEVYADSFIRSSDFEAAKLISELEREDLLAVLEVGENSIQLKPSQITPEYQGILDGLLQHNLVEVNNEGVSILDPSETVVEIQMTELGLRVHREIQNTLITFIKGLPSD